MADAKRISVRNGRFRVQVWSKGRGKPLLYLHGVTGIHGWPAWLDTLTGRYRVAAPQLPGYGDSTGIEQIDDWLELALYHLDLMEALKMRRPAIIGHSLGGNIAAEIAALAPDAVSKLVLVAPTGLWNERDPGIDVFAVTPPELFQASWHDPESAAARAAQPTAETPEEKMALTIDTARSFSTAGKFLWPVPDKGLKRRTYRIKAPALLVWGASDKIVPPGYAPMFKRLIRGSTVVRIPKAGHYPMLEQPARFTAAVKRFLG
jgi:pimeloyl-ACP methyl ester carboxylesterase